MRPGRALRWVCVSPDGESAVSVSQNVKGGGESVMRLWNLRTGEEQKRFEGHTRGPVRAAFAPDGKHLLWGDGWDETIRLWDVETGKELRSFGGPQAPSCLVAISPDGRMALTSGEQLVNVLGRRLEHALRLWDLETGKELRQLQGYRAIGAFSPDGRLALSGSYEGSIRLWEVATGKELYSFDGHESWAYSLVFSRDGLYALSYSQDGTLRRWRLPDPQPANENP
jgi:WD40 repeat protein